MILMKITEISLVAVDNSEQGSLITVWNSDEAR